MSSSAKEPELEALIEEYGSPLFVFYPERFRKNAERYRSAFENAYPNVTMAYSTKTNYVPSVVRCAVECGYAPEAIPGMELDILEELDLLNANAVINGPLKTRGELERIVAAGATINVDNWTELEVLNDIAHRNGRIVDIGIRVCGRIADGTWLRFGFDLDTGLAHKAAAAVKSDFDHLRLTGLHIHLGTNLLDTGIYADASAVLCRFAKELADQDMLELQYLDLGGGFATDCPFLDADPAGWRVPAPADYAAAIAAPILENFGDRLPQLIVEPGRALVDDTIDLLTTVQRMRGEGNEVIVDAGQNIFSSCRYRRHPVSVIGRASDERAAWTLYGPLCMQSDCIGRDVVLPDLKPGDLIKVGYAGAYSLSQSWRFIRYQPAVVEWDAGQTRVIRRAEEASNALTNYVFIA